VYKQPELMLDLPFLCSFNKLRVDHVRKLRGVSGQAGNAVNCFIASLAQLHGLVEWKFRKIPSLFSTLRQVRRTASARVDQRQKHHDQPNIAEAQTDAEAEVDQHDDELPSGRMRRRRITSKTTPPQTSCSSSIGSGGARANAGLQVSNSIRSARRASHRKGIMNKG
jgi:hypothetical protein